MMWRYAQIDNEGRCISVSELSGNVDAPNMIPLGPEENPTGMIWDGEDWQDLPPEPPSFPELTRRQLLLGLLSIGITEVQVDAQINLIESPDERAYSMIEWKAASSFKRDHPLVDSIGAAFALPVEQIDDLWRWASSL